MFRHPARILVNNGLLAMISMISMREACFTQSKRKNKSRQHDDGRSGGEKKVKDIGQID